MAITHKIDYIIDKEYIITGRGIWNSLNHTFNLPARQPFSYPFNHEWLTSQRPQTSDQLHTIVQSIQARETAASASSNSDGFVGTFIRVTGARREMIEERGKDGQGDGKWRASGRVVGRHVIVGELLFAPRMVMVEMRRQ